MAVHVECEYIGPPAYPHEQLTPSCDRETAGGSWHDGWCGADGG